jgi:large subunit ribosomal protein L6
MSRIGKQPVPIPAGVTVSTADRSVRVKGPKGDLNLGLRPEVEVEVSGSSVLVRPAGETQTRQVRALHGMTRALINSMVLGVSQGYRKVLEIIGVGWNATTNGKQVDLNVGYANPVRIPIPQGIQVEIPNPTTIIVLGADKQAVGQLAAVIRKARPPEPYKGKGVRYQGEYVRQKSGKSFGS